MCLKAHCCVAEKQLSKVRVVLVGGGWYRAKTITALSLAEPSLSILLTLTSFLLLVTVKQVHGEVVALSVLVTEVSRGVARRLGSEWSTLIGRDPPDTVLSLVEPYYSGGHGLCHNNTHEGMQNVPFCVLLWHKWLRHRRSLL